MFKLVRIDDENHCEIDLIHGKQVIGRDQMFNCDDKRISRQHAELEATVDSVSIKALHINPCFIVNHDMTEKQIITQNMSISCCHGDKIGFLPDSHWYQINNKATADVLDLHEISPLKATIEALLLKTKASIKEEFAERLTNNLPEQNKSTTDRGTDEPAQASTDEPAQATTDEPAQATTDEPAQATTDEPARAPDSPSLLSANVAEELSQCHEPCDAGNQSPTKRCLVKEEPVSPDAKKVKTELDPEDVKPDINLPSTSDDNEASGDQQPPVQPAQPAQPAQPVQQTPKRERCMYGRDCYRRNPQHKAQFSHPGDADFGSGQLAECPYGYACRKRDPRHWRDHSHPYGMQPPPPPGIKKKRTHIVQRNGNIYYINANVVNFYDDHFEAEDTDGESVDYDYEFD